MCTYIQGPSRAMQWPYSKSPPARPRCWCWVASMCRGASGCSWAPLHRKLSVTSCARWSWFPAAGEPAMPGRGCQWSCPRARLPGGCRPRHPWPRLPVILALDGETAPEPALTLAFDEARLRDARLIVLHSEPISASARDVTGAQLGLEAVLAEWKQAHPDVAIST